MKKWKVALIGCGSIADNTYLPRIGEIPEADLVAVCDIIPERAKNYAEKFHVPAWYTSIDELLEKCDFEILMNTTSIPAHHEINMKALRAGKHLYSQKPVGLTVEEVTEQIEAAKAAGVKYTASPIHMLRDDIRFAKKLIADGCIGEIMNGGGAEKFIGAALEKYPRESFYLATKMPLWKLETQEDMEQVFNEQLANCRVDYFDFYLCHAVDAERFEKIRRIGAFEFLARKKAEGKIRRLGFSFHDKPAVLRAICAAYPWDFAQLQLNYLDWTVQRAREQYEILQEYGLPCIVMEPVRGGALASLCPEAEAVLKAPSD